MNNIALVLAGHGSHINPNTAGLVWSYVDQLREWDVADEVTACFWKEPPAFSEVVETLASDVVVIVPVFTAQGFFTTRVIPAEMGISGETTVINGKTVHYTRTIGEHPYLSEIVRQRVTDVLDHANVDPSETIVAVIGHGAKRNSKSREATRHQADVLRDANLVAQVVDVYLDEAPDIPSIYRTTQAPNIIAVPYFLAPGSHVTVDLPEALGIDYGTYPAQVEGRTVYYTPPVGTDDAICRVILELARDSGYAFEMREADAVWGGFPQAGRAELWDVVQTHGELIFGQLRLTPHEVTHVDQGVPVATLAAPAELREFVRRGQRGDAFRPLPTSDDLPDGWRVAITSAEQLHAVVETVYPTAVAQWALFQRGDLVTDSLETVAQRQQGMVEDVHQLPPEVIDRTIATVCGRCCRQPTWYLSSERWSTDVSTIPCKVACNYFLSAIKSTTG